PSLQLYDHRSRGAGGLPSCSPCREAPGGGVSGEVGGAFWLGERGAAWPGLVLPSSFLPLRLSLLPSSSVSVRRLGGCGDLSRGPRPRGLGRSSEMPSRCGHLAGTRGARVLSGGGGSPFS